MSALYRSNLRMMSCIHQVQCHQITPIRALLRVQPSRTLQQCRRLGFPSHVRAFAEEATSTEQPRVAPIIEKIDLRVGKILSAEVVPEAEELYMEKVDLGEGEPRTILSGLKKYVKVEDLQDRMVVVVANLPSRKMVGIPSEGMLLCASNQDHSVVEPLTPPSEARVGERIFFGTSDVVQSEAASPNQVRKKKIWQEAQPQLKTNAEKVPNFDGQIMLTSQGPVTSTLENANIS